MRNKKVLVIDDDIFISDMIEEAFTQIGAIVIRAENGELGLQQLFKHQPDLVILDIMMPKLNGWETCRQIRLLSDVPIIILTSLDKEEEIVRGLEYGAIDYVTKPFSNKILIARAKSALRRVMPANDVEKSSTFQDGYLQIDLSKRQLSVLDKPIQLTKTEFRLLEYLIDNMDIVLTTEQILENVWGWEYQDSVQYVHVYISRLRRKIEKDPQNPYYLLTEYGVGYRFKASEF